MSYDPNIHHRKSIRLKEYDYSGEGLYFITVCCADKQHLFGSIKDGSVFLENGGMTAKSCWENIPEHFPHAILHEFVVMPNHIHGIIELSGVSVGAENFPPFKQSSGRNVVAENLLPSHNKHEIHKPVPRSIASIVRGFKIGVTKRFRNNSQITTVWQRNYHEHIIRDEQSYANIVQYIQNNPANWENDRFY